MKNARLNKHLLFHPLHCIAVGFGSGLLPKAPGTWGTLVGVLLYWPLSQFTGIGYSLCILIGFVLGVIVCEKTTRFLEVHDHPSIVWDEVLGFWIAMWSLPFDWRAIILAFALFRFFDILKPWPIGWLDKRVSGGVGIMLDDVVAGVMACILGGVIWHFVQYIAY